jgi:hypothetical protein
MPNFELEYTLCQIQSGQFSMAAKSHRQEGGQPILTVTAFPGYVEWRLTDLDHGIAETVTGDPRVNRVDFYFRRETLEAAIGTFPNPRSPVNSNSRYKPTNSVGEVRHGGIGIRMMAPICRFCPIETVDLYSHRPPAFEAHANEAILHLDYETGPARIYGQDIYEVHFGIEAQYTISPLAISVPSYAVLKMSDELYATILSELSRII